MEGFKAAYLSQEERPIILTKHEDFKSTIQAKSNIVAAARARTKKKLQTV